MVQFILVIIICRLNELFLAESRILKRDRIKNIEARANQPLLLTTGCPKEVVPHLSGCCEGDMLSILPFLIRLGSECFTLKFKTLFEPVQRMVDDLLYRKVEK